MIPQPWTTTDPFELSLVSAIQAADAPAFSAVLAKAPPRWAASPSRTQALCMCAQSDFSDGIAAILALPPPPPPDRVGRMPSWSKYLGAALLRPILGPSVSAPAPPALPNPLMLAISNGSMGSIRLLATSEFCSGAFDDHGGTPLMAAASAALSQKADVIRWLLPLSNLQDLGPGGESPLTLAAGLPGAAAVSLLAELFDANLHTDSGETPLSRAAAAGLLENVKALLPFAATGRNDFGPTAAEAARSAGHVEIARLLDDHWSARSARLALLSVGERIDRSKATAPAIDPAPARRAAP